MLAALRDTAKVIARDVDSSDGPFTCPVCKGEVYVKKGRIKIHHFAHKANPECKYGQGESALHMAAKQEIYDCLCKLSWIQCEMEKIWGDVRSDVYAYNKRTGEKFAIEVQISNLSLDEIIYRTECYQRLGVYVLWLPVLSEHYSLLTGKEIHRPRIWEKWLHALYFGRVYYWKAGLEIVPVHFLEVKKYVEANEYGGGYYKTMKIEKRVDYGPHAWFPHYFSSMNRRALDVEKIFVPKSSIAIDKHPIWWETSF